jgi:hypothetical protein
MRDVRKQLIKGLIGAINTKIPGRTVYTQIPKGDYSDPITYPYIWISDIFQDEDGPKNGYMYNLDVLVQIVYSNASSLIPLWDDQDKVLQIIDNGNKFALDDGFEIMDMTLISSDSDEELTNTEKLNIGLVRINFMIE